MENNIYNLIAKHFANETSEAEEELMQELINKDKEIKAEYNKLETAWQKSAVKQKKYDLDRGRHLINQKIIRAQNSRVVSLRRVVQYAAIFIGIALMSFLVKQELYRTETIIASVDEITQISLPDNSIVYLNKNAQITYNASRIKTFERKVELIGEAFFEIANRDDEKFIVDAGNLHIQVLGTKFNVKQNIEQTTVTLNEGKVKLMNFACDEEKQLVMDPGDFISFDTNSGEIQQKHVNPDVYNIWMKKKLTFDNFSITDLSEIFRIHFQKTLVFKSKDFNRRIKGSAPTDDLELLLDAFSEVLETEISVQNDSIIIE